MVNLSIGLLHPGEMGVTLGAAALAAGAQVFWASENRSDTTCQRAKNAGFIDLNSLAKVCQQSDVIISVCPPHNALDLAREVTANRFAGIYVDANAISPDNSRAIQQLIETANSGARFVDGGIIGPPANQNKPGTTRLYLSGTHADEVAKIYHGTFFPAHIVDDRPGSASALKMCYAAYTKGTTALLLLIRALAEAEGISQALVDEWNLSQPGLTERSEKAASNNAHKAWRFVGEMEEIAATCQAAGLPSGFHSSAAELYGRLVEFKDRSDKPELSDVIHTLLK